MNGFFSAKFPLCTILIRYRTIIFSVPNFSPVRLFYTLQFFILNIFLRTFSIKVNNNNNNNNNNNDDDDN